MTDEARIEQTEHGATAATPGWFVVNLADARWMESEEGGHWTDFEPPDGFEHYGIGVHVLPPGKPNGKYHSETVQEDFLVLSGECILIVEDEERRLKAWDFFHCAPGTNHIIVGTGDERGTSRRCGPTGPSSRSRPGRRSARGCGSTRPPRFRPRWRR